MQDEWIWKPERDFVEQTNVWRWMRRLGFDSAEAFLEWSRNDTESFWRSVAVETGIQWYEPYTQIRDVSRGVEWSRWFLDGKLNIAYNCLDRHSGSQHPAIVWHGENGERRQLSFSELGAETCRLANGLRELGLETGDRVALCLPMTPEAAIVLYACLKLGLVLVPIFSGFGTAAISARLQDSGARVVVAADSVERRGKLSPLKSRIDEALNRPNAVERVIVLRYRGGEVPFSDRDIWWDDLVSGQPSICETARLDSEATALLIYTSGTTGKPKGTVHTHAGALAQMTKEIYLAFDHKPEDRFFWLSDIGWMMGPWMLIGNHHFGGTVALYDGAPDFPNPNRLWEYIEQERITTFGISPTAIRLLMRGSTPEEHPMNSLRLLGSTGEPWDETSYGWFFDNVGRRRCPIINISGGTEIVGSFLLPLPIQPLKPCTVGGPSPGMAVDVVDESGTPIRDGRTGYLVCTKPSPSMTRGIWKDPGRYLDTYWSRFPGMWDHGDWASVDSDGCWYVYGRADESMNVAGRKVGPAEVEEALIEHPAVSEAAVIGVPDALKGEGIVAFVVLKAAAGLDEIERHLIATMGATFRPNSIQAVPVLPKTQSGKVVRRLIRQAYLGESLGDISTVDNPSVLAEFKKRS